MPIYSALEIRRMIYCTNNGNRLPKKDDIATTKDITKSTYNIKRYSRGNSPTRDNLAGIR